MNDMHVFNNITCKKMTAATNNYYSTVDDIVLTYSDITRSGYDEEIYIHYERASQNGFDFADYVLPSRMLLRSYGFSEDDLFKLQDYLLNNESIIWELARGSL